MANPMLEEILGAWEPCKGLRSPPREPVLLAQGGTRTVYVENTWGPPVPYPPAEHIDGSRNYGYMRLKGNLGAIVDVPEAHGLPEYQDWLRSLNAENSPLESVGCEKAWFPSTIPGVAVTLASYTDLIFTDYPLNDIPENHLRLAAELSAALVGSEAWWSGAELGVQRLKGLPKCRAPWGLMVRVSGHGRSESEAQSTWGASIKRLCEAVSNLPSEFPLI